MSADYYYASSQYAATAAPHAPHTSQGLYPAAQAPSGPGWHAAAPDPMAGGYPHPYAAPYGAYPAPAYAPQSLAARGSPFLGLTNERFLKGVLIGAAATYLLTNESVQRTAIKGAVKLWGLVQGGVEEIKERFHDAEAELHAAENAKGD